MGSGKVKIVGYAQRTFYDNGIEYRNFSDSLVGQQLTNDGGTTLFTLNNFTITTNLDSKPSKIYTTNKFSSFESLNTLNLTIEDTSIVTQSSQRLILNLDKTDLTNHAYYGSLTEFVRVSLENIIMNWPASLFVDTIDNISYINTGNTVLNYVYDSLTDTSTFETDTNFIFNKYGINYLSNGTIINSFSTTNDLKNLTVNYADYTISGASGEFGIIEFTGSTNQSNDVIRFKTYGNPFSSGSTNQSVKYHIKPNNVNVEKFFNNLNDFESNLLNRYSIPKYRSRYRFPVETDGGTTVYTEENLVWPVSDGYNLDFESTNYITFVGSLLNIASNSDLLKSDLMARFLTSDSISDFDATQNYDGETSGDVMNKTLKIYGREFDTIKRYISGIALANTVTYDKKNNTPDGVLKMLARTMGWQLTSAIVDNGLLANYLDNPTYAGHSNNLSPSEAEIELWRRIIMNTPWIWKSKGTRKAIEFLFKFIGSPEGLVRFNEYVYLTEKPLDIEFFKDVLESITGSRDLTNVTIDNDGYPKTLSNTSSMYFQKGGLWYRETGGPNSFVDILTGNNPHVGPYDGGYEYINQFDCLIPNFSATTVENTVTTSGSTNIFKNYNFGSVNDVTLGEGIVSTTGVTLIETVIDNPVPPIYVNNCGTTLTFDDNSLKIDVDFSKTIAPIDEIKLKISTDGKGGSLFQIDPNETCQLEIKFNYLLSYDCDIVMNSVNSILVDLNNQLITLESDLNLLTIQLNAIETQLITLFALPNQSDPLLILQIDNLTNTLESLKVDILTKQDEIDALNEVITEVSARPTIDVLSNFNSTVTLDKLTFASGTTTYEEIKESTLLSFGDFEQYIEENSSTGIYISGSSCDNLLTTISKELGTNCEVLKTNTLNSDWKEFSMVVSDVDSLSAITNNYIQLSIKVFNQDIPFSILLDNLEVNKVCESTETTSIIVNRCPGFEMVKTIDNRKSWVSTEEYDNREYLLSGRETEYALNNSKLLINTKELDLDIDPANAIECNVYTYFLNNYACALSAGTTDINNLLQTPISGITSSDEFIEVISQELIDAKNRKTLNGYPVLRDMYDRYLGLVNTNCDSSSGYQYIDLQTFADLIGNYWVDLVEQVIPSTTIWGATYVYRNSVFDKQKFNYRKGNIFWGVNNSTLIKPTIATETVDVTVTDVEITTPGVSCIIKTPTPQYFTDVYISNVNNGSEFLGKITVV